MAEIVKFSLPREIIYYILEYLLPSSNYYLLNKEMAARFLPRLATRFIECGFDKIDGLMGDAIFARINKIISCEVVINTLTIGLYVNQRALKCGNIIITTDQKLSTNVVHRQVLYYSYSANTIRFYDISILCDGLNSGKLQESNSRKKFANTILSLLTPKTSELLIYL